MAQTLPPGWLMMTMAIKSEGGSGKQQALLLLFTAMQ